MAALSCNLFCAALLISGVTSSPATVSTLGCNTDQFLHEGRCCNKCPPGYGVRQNCTEKQQTQCSPCVRQQTYGADTPTSRECRACSTCDTELGVALRTCDVFGDAVCSCAKREYFSSTRQRCVTCSICPKGHGVKTECSVSADTQCAVCPLGYYVSTSGRCAKCDICHPPAVQLRSCAPEHDRICRLAPRSGGKFNYTRTPSQSEPAPTRTRSQALYVYCAIMAAVICVVLFYVIFKHRRMVMERRHRKLIPCHVISAPGLSTASAANPAVPTESGSVPNDSDMDIRELIALLYHGRNGNGNRQSDNSNLYYKLRDALEITDATSEAEGLEKLHRACRCPNASLIAVVNDLKRSRVSPVTVPSVGKSTPFLSDKTYSHSAHSPLLLFSEQEHVV